MDQREPLIIYYSEAGWIGRSAILMAGINSIIYVLSTLPPLVFPEIMVEWVLIRLVGSWPTVGVVVRSLCLVLSSCVMVPSSSGQLDYMIRPFIMGMHQYSRGTLRWPSRWVRQAIGCTSMFQRRLKLLSSVSSYSMLPSDIAGDPFHGYIHRKYVYQ